MKRLPRLVLLLFPAAAWLASPAGAQTRDPCEHYVPTGEPLPRQDTVHLSRVIYDDPTSWHGHRVGAVRSGDQVAIIKECGSQLMIQTPDGATGWIATSDLPHEAELARLAAHRPPASEAECDVRFGPPSLVENCKQGVARRQAHADELAHSVNLTGEQLRGFVTGKTVTLTERPNENGVPSHKPPLRIVFEANGELFSSIDLVPTAHLERGRWLVDGDKLCLVGTGEICNLARRIPSGETVFVARNGEEYLATAADGDAQNLVHQVSAVFPFAMPPPVPAGLSGLAHPYMGW